MSNRMTNEKFEELLRQNENRKLEFKTAEQKFPEEKLFKYVAAFANEEGGCVIFGVADAKPRQVCGTQAFPNMEELESKILTTLNLRVTIQEFYPDSAPQKRTVIFTVPRHPIGFPVSYKGEYLMRSGESLTAMTPARLKEIFAEATPDYTATFVEGATLQDLDQEAIDEFRKRWSNKSRNPDIEQISNEQLLSDAELIDLDSDNPITVAALILLGTQKALGRYLAQAEVIFEYYSTDFDGNAAQRVNFREGFFKFYDKLWDLINLRNPKLSYQSGLFILDVDAFNESALREALLNAVSHRDYQSVGSIFIRQYPHRIEINSPGGLIEGITLENILWQQRPRNRRIAENFERCGLVERSGQGMNRIFTACIRESKGFPEFTNTDSHNFCIALNGVIKNEKFLRVLEQIGVEQLSRFTSDDFYIVQSVFDERKLPKNIKSRALELKKLGILEKKNNGSRGWVLAQRFYDAIGRPGLYTRQKGLKDGQNKELLLTHIKQHSENGAPMKDLIDVLPLLDRNQIYKLLCQLKDEGKITSHGKNRGARWFPVK